MYSARERRITWMAFTWLAPAFPLRNPIASGRQAPLSLPLVPPVEQIPGPLPAGARKETTHRGQSETAHTS